MIVSNSSGLIHLTKLSKSSYLRDYADQVAIPEAVHAEVVTRGKQEGYPEASLIEKFEMEGWIKVQALGARARNFARDLATTLGPGEAQAISLAKQTGSSLLIDDDHGRRVAEYYRINTLSTLGILLEFLLVEKITKQEYTSNVRRFSSHAWIAPDVVHEFLRRADMIGQ